MLEQMELQLCDYNRKWLSGDIAARRLLLKFLRDQHGMLEI